MKKEMFKINRYLKQNYEMDPIGGRSNTDSSQNSKKSSSLKGTKNRKNVLRLNQENMDPNHSPLKSYHNKNVDPLSAEKEKHIQSFKSALLKPSSEVLLKNLPQLELIYLQGAHGINEMKNLSSLPAASQIAKDLLTYSISSKEQNESSQKLHKRYMAYKEAHSESIQNLSDDPALKKELNEEKNTLDKNLRAALSEHFDVIQKIPPNDKKQLNSARNMFEKKVDKLITGSANKCQNQIVPPIITSMSTIAAETLSVAKVAAFNAFVLLTGISLIATVGSYLVSKITEGKTDVHTLIKPLSERRPVDRPPLDSKHAPLTETQGLFKSVVAKKTESSAVPKVQPHKTQNFSNH
ncbi:MAG: hypothetical protein K2Q14_03540 [Gammaproteobacteria bacterium]|nr:hypothetical protein [Gammaproteobacteria bacterium]